MSVRERREGLVTKLAPRDREVMHALIERPGHTEEQIAESIRMSHGTLMKRRKHIYAVLGVSTRLELFAIYHVHVLGSCACASDRS